MSRFHFVLSAALWLFICALVAQWSATAAPASPGLRFHPGRILVKPKAGNDLTPLNAARGNRVLAQFRDPEMQVVAVEPGREVEAIAAYQRNGNVEFAEPDYILRAFKVPNDPGYLDGSSWGLHNTGQDGGLAGADLGAELAWDVLDGATNVVVAIVDSGIRYTHEDLAANVWVNPGEVADNGIDDDHNGVIDDLHGFNAYQGNGDPWDDIGHGTHVAGIIGAVGDNKKGTVGVARHVRLMGCRFMDPFGEGATSDAVRCIDYARRNGAQVINASWGGGGFSLALRNAIRRARDAGIIFVAAAGNDAMDLDTDPFYPASFAEANVVTVAATTRDDMLAEYSNTGAKSVLLAAPGSDIYSTWHMSDRSYAYETGTSMATPFVSGVLALTKALFPNETYRQIIARVTAAIDPLSSLDGYCATGGRVSLRKALGVLASTPTKPARLAVTLDPSSSLNGQFSLFGEPGATYQVEASRDLTAWTPLFTKKAAADGSLNFGDPAAFGAKQRYFRARLLPEGK